MSGLPRRWLRRSVTIPLTLVATVLVVTLSPALLGAALLFDLLARRRTLSSVRVVAFAVAFLLTEVAGLALLGGVFVLTLGRPSARQRLTMRVQGLYTATHLRAVTGLFRLRFELEGEQHLEPGPLVVLVRHASLIDTLIPGVFIANRHRLALRYVLKRELLLLPCLDLAGHWLPNRFVTRAGDDTAGEVAAVRELKRDLSANAAVLLYPEGTRFTPQRRAKAFERLTRDPARLARLAGLTHLLPVRPGGVLALLDAPPACDVLLVAHHGLEGFARLGDIWAGNLVGRTVKVRFTRIGAAQLPVTQQERLEQLDAWWLELDRWLDLQDG